MLKNIVIATHYLVYGAPQALREYFINQKIEKLIFIAHPLEIDNTFSYIEFLNKGEMKENTSSRLRTKWSFINYFLEIFLNLKWTYFQKDNFDLWVGVDPLNALCGIILKKFGKIKKVIYYTIDYYPQRFKNKFLNNLYYRLDKFCVIHADEIWNVSSNMIEAREKKYKISSKEREKQKLVPIGIWFDRVKRKDLNEIKRYQAIFVGHLKAEMGIDLIIRSIPFILKKVPSFEFLLIGGGEEYENLKKLCKELNIESHVIMTNWIKDRIQLENLMSNGAIGLAPFNVNIVDEKFYNADPTRIKDYLVMGMPVILTPVPPNTFQLKEAGCAIIIDYNEISLANAIVNIMQDEENLKKFRKNSLDYIKKFDWNNIFKKTLEF